MPSAQIRRHTSVMLIARFTFSSGFNLLTDNNISQIRISASTLRALFMSRIIFTDSSRSDKFDGVNRVQNRGVVS